MVKKTLFDTSGARHWYGGDAITSPYTSGSKPKSLVDAIAGLNEEQLARYLNLRTPSAVR